MSKRTERNPQNFNLTKSRVVYGLAVIAGFAVLGVLIVRMGSAATNTLPVEAESGTIAGPATIESVVTASGGQAVKFAMPVSTCGSGGTCTLAEVATHNKQSDCWVIYKGKVHNITSWVPQHPGGKDVYNDTTCGTDIERYFSGAEAHPNADHAHEHSSSAQSKLASFYVADLK